MIPLFITEGAIGVSAIVLAVVYNVRKCHETPPNYLDAATMNIKVGCLFVGISILNVTIAIIYRLG